MAIRRKTVTGRWSSSAMKKSAGILLYRIKNNNLQFFLVHPGGPFWKNKDVAAWSIPKGEFTEGEDPLAAAKREFTEETGQRIDGDFVELAPIQQKGGKIVFAWAVEGEIDESSIVSNTFQQEWPYKSGKWSSFPEVNKAGWFTSEEARIKINASQVDFIDQLISKLSRF